MTHLTSSQHGLDQGVTLRVDITGILAILFVVVLITCVVIGYGKRSPVDDVAKPIGCHATDQMQTDKARDGIL